jgi:fructokinase
MMAQNNAAEMILVGLGEILWDMLPGGKQLGGAPANFAYHATALGGIGVPVSCIGDDEYGRDIITVLEEHKVRTDGIAVDKQYPTGVVTVHLDAHGKPRYTIHEQVAWDHIPWNDHMQSLAGSAAAVCFGSLAQRSPKSRRTIRQFLAYVPDRCLRVFDINLRQSYYSSEIILGSLNYTDVLKLSDEELPVLDDLFSLGGTVLDQLRQLVDDYSLCAAALTRGAHGCLLVTPAGHAEHPGEPLHSIADTVGAGDAFTAALTIGLLREEKLEHICEHANRLAGFVCSCKGAMPAMELLREYRYPSL